MLQANDSSLHFDRLPVDRKYDFINCIIKGDKLAMKELHDEYELTDFVWTCCNLDGLMLHARNALAEGTV